MITTADFTAVDYEHMAADERQQFRGFIDQYGDQYADLADAYADFLAVRENDK